MSRESGHTCEFFSAILPGFFEANEMLLAVVLPSGDSLSWIMRLC